jgi:hypothetical protein
MSLTVLPSVAKSFVMFCSKCNGDKFHTVITHTAKDAAKVVCEICKKKSTFKLGSDKPKTLTVKKTGSSASKSKSQDTSGEHTKIYSKLIEQLSEKTAMPYSIRTDFPAQAKIEHPKFGLGVVTRVLDDRVEVAFADELRLLVHRRA